MKQLFSLLLVVAAMASCSKNELEAPAVAKTTAIEAYAGIYSSTQTKAVVLKEDGVTGVVFRVIDAETEPTDFSVAEAVAYDGDIAAVEAGKTAAPVTFKPKAPEYEQANDWNAWFIGYYPKETPTNNVVTWAIDGETDILVTEDVWDAGKYSAPIKTGLTFKHQLSQIEVVCQAQNAVSHTAVKAAWGQIKSISFVDAPTEMTYDYSTLTVANGTTLANKELLAAYDGTAFSAIDIPANGSTDKNAVAMLAPVTAADATTSFQLEIVTEGPTADTGDDIKSTVKVKIGNADAADMTKGQTHKVTLTFKLDAKTIEVTEATIEDWTAGPDATGDVEKPIILPKETIVFGKAPFDKTEVTVTGYAAGTYTIPGATSTSYNTIAPGYKYFETIDNATTGILPTGELPYAKLQYALKDEDNGTEMTWQDAWDYCKNKATDGGGWRLPRASEMMLLFANITEMEKVEGFIALTAATNYSNYDYWLGTENGSSTAWTISFDKIISPMDVPTDKTQEHKVRCVKEHL